MTTININLYSIAALVGDEYDGWTPPSVVPVSYTHLTLPTKA